MQKRRFEKVAVMLLSVIMLLTSTGIISSLAVNVSESSAAPETSATETSSSTVTQEGGTVTTTTVTEEGGTVTVDNGDGTKANPYKISTAEDFLAIGNKVNDTSSADKYFVLTNDIDLSEVTAKDFENGSLIGIDKTLGATAPNVFIVLDGNGYSLKGLSVELKKGTEASVFGTVNAKSVIRNIRIDTPVIRSTSDDMSRIAVLATENNGTITGIELIRPVLTVKAADYTALAVAVNNGTVSEVYIRGSQNNISASTADSHSVSSVGTIGAVAGLNHGTVTNVSVIHVGMFIPQTDSSVLVGGIAGANSGSVLNSVSTGNVMGGKASDVVGGVVGQAVAPVGGDEATSTLTNNYTLVAITKAVSGCGVIGADGTAEMMKDCFWSSAVSGKDVMSTDFGAGVNELTNREFIIIPEGKTVTFKASDVKSTSFGKANAELAGAFSVKGNGVKAEITEGKAEIRAEKAGNIAYLTYSANIMFPANVGAEKAGSTLSQYQRICLYTASKDAKGDGSKASPFEIKSMTDFQLFNYAPSLHAVLGADIKVPVTAPAIKGSFDGNGYTIKATNSIVSAVYGTFRNVNINVASDISSALIGSAVGADVSGVAVSMADGVKFNAQADNNGILFGRISGPSVIDDCHAKGEIFIGEDKLSAIGGFAGLVDGKAKITNSGSVADINIGKNVSATKVANFIGSVAAEDVTVSACYVGGANPAGESVLIADKPEKIKIENIVTGWSFDGGNIGFFTGNGGEFTATLPAIKAFSASSAKDYEVVTDGEKVVSSVSVADGKLTLKIERAKGVVTLKAVPVSVINKKTGLGATINVSNGLEKDADGRYIISTAYDLAYIGENIAELADANFIVTADIDMSSLSSFAPIGSTDVAFRGTFDGNGKTIKNISIDGTAKVGLFGVLNGATVKNIRFANANVVSTGGYVGVLAGQVTGKTTVSDITVDGAKIQSGDLYAGALIGAVDSVDADTSIKNITLNNITVVSESNYVGSVAGRVNGKADISNITLDIFKADGASYVAGIIGLAQGEVTLNNVSVTDAELSGVSEVSGIASGNGDVTVRSASVKNSDIATLAITSANTAGGISAIFGSTIEDVTVENTTVTAGVAGGIVGKTTADCSLTIKNADVKSSKINSQDANTVAAGILAVHNVKGTATVEAVSVDEKTEINGAAVTAGLVGDCSGADSVLSVSDAKTLATVNGSMTANAVSAAGALGRIGVSAVSNVSLSSLKVGGNVSGAAAVGGIVGLVKNGKKYDGTGAVIADSVVFAQINKEKATSAAIIFGAIEGDVFNTDLAALAVRGVILTTYYGTDAYPADTLSFGYTDMNAGIVPSQDTLDNLDETTVKLDVLPSVVGYAFDETTGWVSESADRVQVVSSTEKEVVLKAERRAQVKIVGYYVLSDDEQVRLPVSFDVVANVYEPLNGKGTKAEPYLVNNAYELEAVSQYADKGAYFALAQDIVLTPADYEFGGAFYNLGNGAVSIGSAEKPFNGVFTGLYKGKVHSITGLKMTGNTFGGLFAVTDGASVTDLIINGAEISATVNAGILAGRATDSVFRNIVINSSGVETTGFGSTVGGVVGVAQATTVENVEIKSVSVNTTSDATGATVEVAGGVAGVFDGAVKNVAVTDAKVNSDTIAAGAIGVANKGTYISATSINAQINAEVAGGVIGEANDVMYLNVDGVSVSGNVNGEKVSSGIIAKISDTDENNSLDKLNKSLVSNTVITAKISDKGVRAVVIGEISDRIAVDKENTDTQVFEKVYFSSYQNNMGAFGTENFNAYQNTEYDVIDLSEISYSVNGKVYDAISLSTDATVLTDDSIIMNAVSGNYKSFTAGGKAFTLSTITSSSDGLVVYDAQSNSLRLTQLPTEPAKLVFVYNDGLEIAIDISTEKVETDEDTVLVKLNLVDATSKADVRNALVAVMLKSKIDGKSSSAEFFTQADSKATSIAPMQIEDGRLYVDMHLPEGCTFSVNAVGESSENLSAESAGNEGTVITVGEAKNITLTVTVEDESDSIWGLRSLWSVIGK